MWLCERLAGSSLSAREVAFGGLSEDPQEFVKGFSLYWDDWPSDPWPKLDTPGKALRILPGSLENALEILRNASGIDYEVFGNPLLGNIPEIRIPGASDLEGSVNLLVSVSDLPVLVRWNATRQKIQITSEGRLALSAGEEDSPNYASRKRFLQAFVRGQDRDFEISEKGDIFWFWGNSLLAESVALDLRRLLGKANSVVSGNVSWRTELLFVSGKEIPDRVPGEDYQGFVTGPDGFLLSGKNLGDVLVEFLSNQSRSSWVMSSGTAWWNPVRDTGINLGSICGRRNFSGDFLPEKDLRFFLNNANDISASWGDTNLSLEFSEYSDLVFGRYLGEDFGGWVLVFLLQKDFGTEQTQITIQERQSSDEELL